MTLLKMAIASQVEMSLSALGLKKPSAAPLFFKLRYSVFEIGDLVRTREMIGLILEKKAMKHTHGERIIWWYTVDFFDEKEFEPRFISEVNIFSLDI